ncbi:type II secretion system protein [Sporosarcina sp. FSL K6-6792]|uniref:PulJ/GspJ family protein n=1 Tax=Sporosarcina sp. FSL K6-6792 TaxID=2921559 RepID=UPI0030F7D6C5
MKKKFQSENGMTLIEILAALVILGIVFIGFMTIFPQMTAFNEKTGDKLETMNLAKEELAYWKRKEGAYSLSDFDKYQRVMIAEDKVRRFPGHVENSEIDFYESEDLKGNSHKDSFWLHKIHIKILREGEILSETYGYIKVR